MMHSKQLERLVVMFSAVALAQEQKGLQKYGKALEPLDNYDWLKMAFEEQVDGAAYLNAEMDKRSYVCDEIRKITDDERILQLLNLLEGKGEVSEDDLAPMDK